jgi:acetylornithine/N-succinyldiaminopimelate aminotransferase
MEAFTYQPVLGHITTFGGHPVCCAAGLAAAGIITPQLLSHVRDMEQLFVALLQHPRIKEVRSAGLLMAVQLESAAFNMAVIKQLLQHGIITDWFLFAADCLRIAPPLIITEQEVRHACKAIIQALDSITVES